MYIFSVWKTEAKMFHGMNKENKKRLVLSPYTANIPKGNEKSVADGCLLITRFHAC